MRMIHTADWHLGRLFYGVQLTDDQAFVLDQLVRLVEETRPDVVLVTGDIYDRAVPPPEAVTLLDDVLSRIILGLGVPVCLIAGNHDSPGRLGFASRLLAPQGLHVVGSLGEGPRALLLADEHGPVHIYALPYAEPSMVRGALGDETVVDQESALRARLRQIHGAHPAGERAVLLAHAFVAGGETTDSERPLSVGGAGSVAPDCFNGFAYVALGHLHRPQTAGGEAMRYAGSLLKYSFSESKHRKSLNLVELDGKGRARVKALPLEPRRDVRTYSGYLNEVVRRGEGDPAREDYMMITLLNKGPILDAMGKLREAYPNVLHIERPGLAPAEGALSEGGGDHRTAGDAELFASFFEQVTGEALSPEEQSAYRSVVEAWRQSEREGGR